jgi:tRNA-2-methylthio-N6-dimethylallyladenosine synthase
MEKVLLKTFGCAMNFYDSEVAEGILEAAGYRILRKGPSRNSAGSEGDADGGVSSVRRGSRDEDADVVLLNTCSVREHAEDRIWGRLGMLGKIKKKKPDLIVGLMGCMVEEHREKIFKRFPQLDLMVGTRNIKELPVLIEQVRRQRRQVARIKQDGISIEYAGRIKRRGRFHAWLPIMTGCDKCCTFCIVPKTRGSEVSMPAEAVYAEACRLVEDGVKWVTLLGQNVNSYSGNQTIAHSSPTAAKANHGLSTWDYGQGVSFPQLLDMLCQIPGLERISFTTSHPQDATEELFQAIARNQKISRRFHLPLQSGADRILKRMKRLHTYPEYKEKINRLRVLVPDVSITTDMIAGFPGETEEDHRATVRALEEIRFDGAYIYKYSTRPGTPAAKLADDVPVAVKDKRNAELLGLQKGISREIHERLIGQTIGVFVEDLSVKDRTKLLGRSHSEKKVVFEGGKNLLGTFQKVRLERLRHETFVGNLPHHA